MQTENDASFPVPSLYCAAVDKHYTVIIFHKCTDLVVCVLQGIKIHLPIFPTPPTSCPFEYRDDHCGLAPYHHTLFLIYLSIEVIYVCVSGIWKPLHISSCFCSCEVEHRAVVGGLLVVRV